MLKIFRERGKYLEKISEQDALNLNVKIHFLGEQSIFLRMQNFEFEQCTIQGRKCSILDFQTKLVRKLLEHFFFKIQGINYENF